MVGVKATPTITNRRDFAIRPMLRSPGLTPAGRDVHTGNPGIPNSNGMKLTAAINIPRPKTDYVIGQKW